MNIKKYIIYKIINTINSKIYIGSHSTYDINDLYMGSGTNLKKDQIIYGINNFTKEIIHIFDNKSDMMLKENELVNDEFVKRNDTYNIIKGGGWNTSGCITVRDNNGSVFMVQKNDPRFTSGELVGSTKGLFNAKDKNDNIFKISKKDPRFISGELVGMTKGMSFVKDKNGNKLFINKNDNRILSGELVGHSKGLFNAKDKNGNIFKTSVNDPRLLSGELVGSTKGYLVSNETKLKLSKSKSGTGCGENNTQYGTCWINNILLNISKRINKSDLDLWIKDGWVIGMGQDIKNKISSSVKKQKG